MTQPKKKRTFKSTIEMIEYRLDRCRKCGGKRKVSGRYTGTGSEQKYELGVECRRCGDWT